MPTALVVQLTVPDLCAAFSAFVEKTSITVAAIGTNDVIRDFLVNSFVSFLVYRSLITAIEASYTHATPIVTTFDYIIFFFSKYKQSSNV